MLFLIPLIMLFHWASSKKVFKKSPPFCCSYTADECREYFFLLQKIYKNRVYNNKKKRTENAKTFPYTERMSELRIISSQPGINSKWSVYIYIIFTFISIHRIISLFVFASLLSSLSSSLSLSSPSYWSPSSFSSVSISAPIWISACNYFVICTFWKILCCHTWHWFKIWAMKIMYLVVFSW